MTYDRQDLLLDLRKLAVDNTDTEAHMAADTALLRLIDDEQISTAYDAIAKWYA